MSREPYAALGFGPLGTRVIVGVSQEGAAQLMLLLAEHAERTVGGVGPHIGQYLRERAAAARDIDPADIDPDAPRRQFCGGGIIDQEHIDTCPAPHDQYSPSWLSGAER